jgi:hypothetical protein
MGGVTDPKPYPLVNSLGGEGGDGGWLRHKRFNNSRHDWFWFGHNEPFGTQPHHEIWAFQALGDPSQKHMNYVNHTTLFQSHVFQPLALWHVSPYSTNLDETFFSFPQTTQSEQLDWIHFHINISPLSDMNFLGC